MMEEDDFLALFEQETRVAQEPTKIPETIKMTEGVMKKINTLCQVVDELTYISSEWHAFLLANRNDPTALIRDIYIAEGAEVGPGETILRPQILARVAEKDIKEYNKEKNKDYVIVGVVHSHGNIRVFHSGIDDDNFDNIINAYSAGTKSYSREKLDLIEGKVKKEVKDSEVIFSGSALEDALVKCALPDESSVKKILEANNIKGTEKLKGLNKALAQILSEIDLQTEQTKSTGFAYSIVVNSNEDTPYAEIGIREFTTLTGESRIKKIKGVKVEPVEAEDDITVDESELLREAANKFEFSKGVKWKVRKLKRYYDSKKKKYQFKESSDEEEDSSHSVIGFSDWFKNQDYEDYDDGYVPTTRNPGTSQRQPLYTTPSGTIIYKSEPELVDKVEQDSVELEELVRWFVYSSLNYVSHYRFKEYKYSVYLERILDNIDSSGYSAGKNKELSLRDAIERVGELREDADKVPKPKMYFSAEKITRVIKENLQSPLKDKPEVHLMIEFIDSPSAAQQNLVLEKYMPIILGE